MTLSTVSANFTQHDLIVAGHTQIVAVSGGNDSVALLHILCELRASLGLRLHIATLNHGLRGEQSKHDLKFVEQLAKDCQLPFTGGHANVQRLAAEQGMGIEEAARKARYDFLARVAVQEGADCVVVGHHAFDQAETILMHIIRGSGLHGLRGMQISSPMPYHPGLKLIRPLLNVSRSELEQYCLTNRLEYRHDHSNDDSSYQRNFVRHFSLRPLLERHPNLLRSFARLADAASVDEDLLASYFEAEVLPLATIRDESWSISIAGFEELHLSMKRRFLRRACMKLACGGEGLSHDLSVDVIHWLEGATVGKSRDLGRMLRLRMGYEVLHIEREDADPRCSDYRVIPADTDLRLAVPSQLVLGDLSIEALHCIQSTDSGLALVLLAAADLSLRTRRAGDRFRPKGMNGHSRKLKDWMIDRKIPRQLRKQIPLLCADGEIIAICVKDTWHLAEAPRDGFIADEFITLILK